jgi:hypothetical protein
VGAWMGWVDGRRAGGREGGQGGREGSYTYTAAATAKTVADYVHCAAALLCCMQWREAEGLEFAYCCTRDVKQR